jgi:hypothetical protein
MADIPVFLNSALAMATRLRWHYLSLLKSDFSGIFDR